MHAGVLSVIVAAAGCARVDEGPGRPLVRIFVAASLYEAIHQVAADYKAAHGVDVHINSAASSTLARQMMAGAPVDLFISANKRWMDEINQRGMVDSDSIVSFAGNELVVASASREAAGQPARAIDVLLDGEGRIAVGDAAHVPLGMYTQQWMQNAGVLEALQPRLMAAHDASATRRLLEIREVTWAVLYATDVAASGELHVAAVVESQWHDPIEYQAALAVGAGEAAGALLDHLTSAEGQAVLARAGFRAAVQASEGGDVPGASAR